MGCEGEPIELQDYLPPELQALRKKIAGYTSGKLGETATQLPAGMPLSAGTNQLQLNSAQLMNQLMGGGDFGMAPYRTAGGNYAQGGGVGGGSKPKTGPGKNWGGAPTTNPEDLSGIYSLQNTLRGTQSVGNILQNLGAGYVPPGKIGATTAPSGAPPANNPWIEMLKQRLGRYLPQGYNG